MLDSFVRGPHAGQELTSLVLVLVAVAYGVFAVFGRPHEAVRPLVDGIPLAALLGVYTYAFDLGQHEAYSTLLGAIVGLPVSSAALLVVGAAIGFAQPFLKGYSRIRAVQRTRGWQTHGEAKALDAGVVLSIVVRMAVSAFWITLGLLVALNQYDLLRGRHLSLATAIFIGVVLAFLAHLPQLADAARERTGEQTGVGGRTVLSILAGVAGLAIFAAGLSLVVFLIWHLGWSLLLFLLLFFLISGAVRASTTIVSHLPRPAIIGVVVVLLLIAGGFQLAVRG